MQLPVLCDGLFVVINFWETQGKQAYHLLNSLLILMKRVIPVFLSLIAVHLLIINGLAQTANPSVVITVTADGKPIDQQTGLSVATKVIQFNGKLQGLNSSRQNEMKPDLIIKGLKLTLARNGHILAKLNWASVSRIENAFDNAQPGDFLILQFTVAAQGKDGKIMPLSTQPVYKFPFY